MTKYQPLADFLTAQVSPSVRLSFEKIEDSLGFRLPRSAREYAGWWSNHPKGHSQARAWMDRGWQAWEVDLKKEQVKFQRTVTEDDPKPDSIHQVATQVCFDLSLLSPAAEKLYRDYREEAEGDGAAAVTRALHEAAMARRRRVIDEIMAKAVAMPVGAQSAADMIREDRDRDDR